MTDQRSQSLFKDENRRTIALQKGNKLESVCRTAPQLQVSRALCRDIGAASHDFIVYIQHWTQHRSTFPLHAAATGLEM